MALKVLGAGQWCIRNIPLCLFRWSPTFSTEGPKPTHYPVWVELPNLPMQYYPFIHKLVEPLGKILGKRRQQDFNPRWHPQVLVEMDLDGQFPPIIEIYRDDGVKVIDRRVIELHFLSSSLSPLQEVAYKHLPNACFHCSLQGHGIKVCPAKRVQRTVAPQQVTPKGGAHIEAGKAEFTLSIRNTKDRENLHGKINLLRSTDLLY